MDNTTYFEKLAELNPCVKFVIDNYDMLCCAHSDKVVMVMNGNEFCVDGAQAPSAYVAKVFGSMTEAMLYTDALDMGHVPYVLKACDGLDVTKDFLFSVGCKTPD